MPTAFTNEFTDQKQVMWAVFLKKNRIDDAPNRLVDTNQVLKEFFDPIISTTEKKFSRWSPQFGMKE